MTDILKIPSLIGRTIVDATRWADNESMSLRLDNNAIVQIRGELDNHDFDVVVAYEIEVPTEGQPNRTMEHEMLDIVGERCADYEPGCAACDMWEAWDLHAYNYIRRELDETIAWFNEAAEEQSKDYFDRYIAGDR